MVEDTEEMKTWRGSSQSEMDLRWQNLAARMEDEVLEKYKVEESKRAAFGGRRRRARRNKKYRKRKCGEDCWARRIFLC